MIRRESAPSTAPDASAGPAVGSGGHSPEAAEQGLRADRVERTIGSARILDGVTLAPRPGETVGLLGPNGSGKSTLLRALSGVLAPSGGAVLLDGTPLARIPRRAAARRIAAVEQVAHTQTELTVRDVVGLGRTPHRRAWTPPSKADTAAVGAALERTGLTDLAARSWHTLSGGERQRAQIARALAQEPDELLLDEPTNHLDIQYQIDLMELVVSLPVTTVIAMHDLNLAAMYCDRLVLLRRGTAVAEGTPTDVLTPATIQAVYGVATDVAPGPGYPVIRFLRPGAPEPLEG